jgi:hypothetical protein
VATTISAADLAAAASLNPDYTETEAAVIARAAVIDRIQVAMMRDRNHRSHIL